MDDQQPNINIEGNVSGGNVNVDGTQTFHGDVNFYTILQQATETTRAISVFISYARADAKAFAIKLHRDLRENEINAWIDQSDMPSGDTFIAEIDRAIEEADYPATDGQEFPTTISTPEHPLKPWLARCRW